MDDAAKQPGGVNGREFASPKAVSGFDVNEVIEEAVFLLCLPGEEFEGCERTFSGGGFFEIAASGRDAERTEGEACRGGAADATIIIPICFGAILCDAGPRRGLLVE